MTALSPELNAPADMRTYWASVQPAYFARSAFKLPTMLLTPSLRFTAGLNTDVAHSTDCMSIVRFGWPSASSAAVASPQAGVTWMRPNDFDSASVQPACVPQGLSGLIEKMSKLDSCWICALTIIGSGCP